MLQFAIITIDECFEYHHKFIISHDSVYLWLCATSTRKRPLPVRYCLWSWYIKPGIVSNDHSGSLMVSEYYCGSCLFAFANTRFFSKILHVIMYVYIPCLTLAMNHSYYTEDHKITDF